MDKILIIEDDPVIRTQLQTLLLANGYDAIVVSEFDKTVQTVSDQKPQLVILDVKLPGQNGFAICSQIRTFSEVPIIFVTSCNTDMDELNSIMTGGDAFITKPYNTPILLAKIAFLLKRAYPENRAKRLVWNGAELHPENSTMEYGGKVVELTKNELKILHYLFCHAGVICTRSDLVEYLWDNQLYVDDNALSVNVGRIRTKLSDIGLSDFIKTKHRQGYLI